MAQISGSGETNFKEVNTITTRSGKVIELAIQSRENEKESSKPNESSPSEEVAEVPVRVPFPQALKSTSKSTTQHNEILEHLKQVSAVTEQRIPPKYNDSGCPTISSVIGNREFTQALLNLGTSVNLVLCYIPVVRSTIRPKRLVEDVLVQIDKFYYPIDFLVLDVKVEVNVDSKIPIILGRPFFATTNALINCRNSLMKLSFRNITLEVNIFHVTKQPREEDESHQTYMIDGLTQEEAFAKIDYDPLNSFLLNSKISIGFDIDEYTNICVVFAKLQDHGTLPWQPKFEELLEMTGGQKPSSIESPKPELKQLPPGLKHVFLGLDDTFPLLSILNENKSGPIANSKWEVKCCYSQGPFLSPFFGPNTRTCSWSFLLLLPRWILWMPFGLCNAPATFQICMMSMFSDMVDDCMEVFMDDLTVFGTSFDACLLNLKRVLARCEEKCLVLNWVTSCCLPVLIGGLYKISHLYLNPM
ncbi:uncharacterized protein LOC111370155 [Olea europaea var. sylvestris]|uniref:uncharacterized protein LOC111370155 n=1 Tax=Olea europaea var. sylvestris TaxID=158386 RepID=UPI000C1CD853|nr:uncharacterized protein LOC111370155 [Olea europaea var. sylvestris]